MPDTMEYNDVRRAPPIYGLLLALTAILITSLAVMLDVPVLRPVLGFAGYIILSGAIILAVIKADRIGLTRKLVLSAGLGIAFLMFTGFFIDLVYYAIGYQTPLSTPSLVYSFGAILVVLTLIAYRFNREAFALTMPKLNIDAGSLMLSVIALTFPVLAILGANIMNASDDNIVLMCLLFLIPFFALVLFMRKRSNADGLYPWAVFMIGVSLICMFVFRGSHITGQDIHLEYFVSREVFSSLHIFVGEAYIESCLSITLLPVVFQSLTGLSGEIILKYLYPLMLVLTPLSIYILSSKYFSKPYAFLAAFFFMAQTPFYRVVSLRDMLATMFIALAAMAIFSESKGMGLVQKRAIFISMVSAVIVSHYATSLMFGILLILGWLLSLLLIRMAPEKVNNITVNAILFVIVGVFFWQSQIWGKPFEAGLWYIKNTFNYLADFYSMDSRSGIAQQFLSGGGSSTTLPESIQMYLMYATIALMAIGIAFMVLRYKSTLAKISPDTPSDGFLNRKFDLEYLTLAALAFIMLVIQVVLPFLSTGYNLSRSYMVALVFLAPVFVVGGAKLAQCFRLKPGVILLLVMLPYFTFTSGVAYQLFDVPRSMHLNSTGDEYHRFYVHDQEYAALDWLEEKYYSQNDPLPVYGDWVGVEERLKDRIYFTELLVLEPDSSQEYLESIADNYIYLSYDNVVRGKMGAWGNVEHDLSEYAEVLGSKNKVYSNGGSEVYK